MMLDATRQILTAAFPLHLDCFIHSNCTNIEMDSLTVTLLALLSIFHINNLTSNGNFERLAMVSSSSKSKCALPIDTSVEVEYCLAIQYVGCR
jgi:hypothetical protein